MGPVRAPAARSLQPVVAGWVSAARCVMASERRSWPSGSSLHVPRRSPTARTRRHPGCRTRPGQGAWLVRRTEGHRARTAQHPPAGDQRAGARQPFVADAPKQLQLVADGGRSCLSPVSLQASLSRNGLSFIMGSVFGQAERVVGCSSSEHPSSCVSLEEFPCALSRHALLLSPLPSLRAPFPLVPPRRDRLTMAPPSCAVCCRPSSGRASSAAAQAPAPRCRC